MGYNILGGSGGASSGVDATARAQAAAAKAKIDGLIVPSGETVPAGDMVIVDNWPYINDTTAPITVPTTRTQASMETAGFTAADLTNPVIVGEVVISATSLIGAAVPDGAKIGRDIGSTPNVDYQVVNGAWVKQAVPDAVVIPRHYTPAKRTVATKAVAPTAAETAATITKDSTATIQLSDNTVERWTHSGTAWALNQTDATVEVGEYRGTWDVSVETGYPTGVNAALDYWEVTGVTDVQEILGGLDWNGEKLFNDDLLIAQDATGSAFSKAAATDMPIVMSLAEVRVGTDITNRTMSPANTNRMLHDYAGAASKSLDYGHSDYLVRGGKFLVPQGTKIDGPRDYKDATIATLMDVGRWGTPNSRYQHIQSVNGVFTYIRTTANVTAVPIVWSDWAVPFGNEIMPAVDGGADSTSATPLYPGLHYRLDDGVFRIVTDIDNWPVGSRVTVTLREGVTSATITNSDDPYPTGDTHYDRAEANGAWVRVPRESNTVRTQYAIRDDATVKTYGATEYIDRFGATIAAPELVDGSTAGTTVRWQGDDPQSITIPLTAGTGTSITITARNNSRADPFTLQLRRAGGVVFERIIDMADFPIGTTPSTQTYDTGTQIVAGDEVYLYSASSTGTAFTFHEVSVSGAAKLARLLYEKNGTYSDAAGGATTIATGETLVDDLVPDSAGATWLNIGGGEYRLDATTTTPGTFFGLTDTPNDATGLAGKFWRMNAAGDALEAVDIPANGSLKGTYTPSATLPDAAAITAAGDYHLVLTDGAADEPFTGVTLKAGDELVALIDVPAVAADWYVRKADTAYQTGAGFLNGTDAVPKVWTEKVLHDDVTSMIRNTTHVIWTTTYAGYGRGDLAGGMVGAIEYVWDGGTLYHAQVAAVPANTQPSTDDGTNWKAITPVIEYLDTTDGQALEWGKRYILHPTFDYIFPAVTKTGGNEWIIALPSNRNWQTFTGAWTGSGTDTIGDGQTLSAESDAIRFIAYLGTPSNIALHVGGDATAPIFETVDTRANLPDPITVPVGTVYNVVSDTAALSGLVTAFGTQGASTSQGWSS